MQCTWTIKAWNGQIQIIFFVWQQIFVFFFGGKHTTRNLFHSHIFRSSNFAVQPPDFDVETTLKQQFSIWSVNAYKFIAWKTIFFLISSLALLVDTIIDTVAIFGTESISFPTRKRPKMALLGEINEKRASAKNYNASRLAGMTTWIRKSEM